MTQMNTDKDENRGKPCLAYARDETGSPGRIGCLKICAICVICGWFYE
jgi:hypothetical protein